MSLLQLNLFSWEIVSFHPKIFNLYSLASVCLGKHHPSEPMRSVSSPAVSVGESLFHQTALCSAWREEAQCGPGGVDSRTSDSCSESTYCIPSEGVMGSLVLVWLTILRRTVIILYVPYSKLGCLCEPDHVQAIENRKPLSLRRTLSKDTA